MVPGKRFARRRRDGSAPRSGFPRASRDAYGMGRPAHRPARIEGGCWPWATTRTRKPPVTAVGNLASEDREPSFQHLTQGHATG